MPGWTNRGKLKQLERSCGRVAQPTNYYIALITSTPDEDDNIMTDLTEFSGTGYTSGGGTAGQLTPGATDFDVSNEDDTGNSAYVQIKNIVFTAGSAWSGINYAVMTDDNATVGSREVYYYWDLSGPISVSSGQTLTLEDLQIDITET